MKDIFCARCQQITSHKVTVDQNGDFLFECQNQIGTDGETPVLCDRFIKLPGSHPVEEVDSYFEAHKTVNEGQVSIEDQEKKLAEILGSVVSEKPESTSSVEEDDKV